MTVATHLPLNEREQRVKKTSDPVARTRFLAVYHATQGRTATAIATITVPSTRWVQQVVRRDNQEGPAALEDRRHTTPGQRPTLPLEEQQRVLAALQAPLPMGAGGRGLRCGPGWRGNWGRNAPAPPSSASCTSWASPAASLARSSGSGMRRRRWSLKNTFPSGRSGSEGGQEGNLLADDEHRLGRTPVYRRVWRRTGERPTAVVAHRSHWCSVCTVVEPTTGWNLRRVVDGIDTQVMSWVVTALTGMMPGWCWTGRGGMAHQGWRFLKGCG